MSEQPSRYTESGIAPDGWGNGGDNPPNLRSAIVPAPTAEAEFTPCAHYRALLGSCALWPCTLPQGHDGECRFLSPTQFARELAKASTAPTTTTAEPCRGWVCPVCGCGVAPTVTQCPCVSALDKDELTVAFEVARIRIASMIEERWQKAIGSGQSMSGWVYSMIDAVKTMPARYDEAKAEGGE